MNDALSVQSLEVTLGRRAVLSDLSFEHPLGKLLGVLGPNGAGKTTLLKAIAGIISYRGEIRLREQLLSHLDPRARARQVAYVPQRSLLNAPLNVLEVVEQGRFCHHSGQALLGARDQLAVQTALSNTDIGALATRRFTELSGGEQRRVLLARALATEAPLIVLDEPAASLDVSHTLTLFHHLKRLTEQGHTIIMALHDLNDAITWCDSVLFLAQGSSPVQGVPREVITPALVRRVYGVELSERVSFAYDLKRSSGD